MVDYLFWDYENARFLGANLSGLDDHGSRSGWRGTLGRRWDCNSGHEITYMGFDPWIAVTQETSAAGNLFGNFTTFGNFPPSSISAFRNNTFVEQFEKQRLHSVELNRTGWGWDVVKTQLGFRYIYFNDLWRLTTGNLAGETGIYRLETTNYLFGPQIGMELFYDIGYRLSFSTSTKLGGYVNVNRGVTQIFNDVVTTINTTDKDSSWSATAEVGFYGHYQILPRVRARFGYEALVLWDVATTPANFTNFVGPTTGIDYADDDNAFFHGIFAGIEIYR
jgi:hypothetical protein